MKKQKVCVLVGPTASGKTAIGVELAKKMNGEIISADSMQIYKLMNIGTAKPTPEERNGIPHHLIDFVDPDENYSVAQFSDDAKKCIKNLVEANKTPIIVGGTGLYINGLTMPWGFRDESKNDLIRKRLEAVSREEGGKEKLYDRLSIIDPEAAKNIHQNNVQRVIRAIEIFEVTGKPKTKWDNEAKLLPVEYDYVLAGLSWDRTVLYQRIDHRVDMMMEQGLLDEIRSLIAKGYGRDCQSMKALGYKEFFPYFDNEIDLDEAVRILKRDTRHFAKRQLTWFRKDHRISWFECDKFDSASQIAEAIHSYFTE